MPSAGDVQAVDAVLLQKTGDDRRIGKCVPIRDEIGTGEPNDEGKVPACCFLYCFYDFQQETRPVFRIAAVSVLPPIGCL